MANKQTPPSLQDILRKRQQSDFVGRAQQVADFRANLRFDVTDERRKFIFCVSGQGGVGKTWLARRLRKIAEEFGAATALTDEAETDVPSAMGRIADQLEEQGHPLKAFSERYKVYRQRKQELEADPDAPQGLTAFVTRTVVDVGFDLLEHTPAGVVTKRLPKEMLATQASEWAEFVRRRLGNKDETRLVLEPIPVLTPLWLAGLAEVAQEHPLALFLDTYERTCPFLDPWLREVIEGKHGVVSPNILWCISGRDALDDNDWAPYRGLVAAAALEPFSEEEAREYLGGKGIAEPKIVEVILRLSGRLPLLVATLATQSPSDAEHIEDPADTAVERFLKWVEDPAQRRAALHAALPQRLNQDILAYLVEPAQTEMLFAWLQTMPFVQKRGDYWEYHEVVRSAMLRYLRTQSPKTWADLHRRLAERYEAAREALELDADAGCRDNAWQELALEALYHRLCQAPKASQPAAINGFLAALKSELALAKRWAAVLSRAGEDASAIECAIWGKQLVDGVKAYDDDRYDTAIDMFTAILEYPVLESAVRPTAFGWRGYLYWRADLYDQAITDLSESISLAPNVAEYWTDRGAAFLWKEHHADALADFDHAIALDADDARTIAFRGETYRQTEQYEEALADFDRALTIDSDDAWALSHRGETYRQIGRCDCALTDFDRAIVLDPDDYWALANRGETYRQMRQCDKALVDFDRAIELSPDKSWILASRGETYQDMHQFDKALTDFDRAIKLAPSASWIIADRAEVRRLMGRYEESLADFNRVRELAPEDDNAINRGLVLSYLGRYEEAIEAYMEYLKLYPGDYASLYNIAVVMVRWKGLILGQSAISQACEALQGAEADVKGAVLYGLGGLAALREDSEQALDYLRQAIPLEKSAIEWAQHDIAWLELRTNPRFRALLAGEVSD